MPARQHAAGVVLSDLHPPFEWLSRYLGHHPQAKLQSGDPTRVPVVDGMAVPVRSKWIYAVFTLRAAPRVTWVGVEIFVDSSGNCFFAKLDKNHTPLSPIGDRTPQLHDAGASGPTFRLPMTDASGRAVEARLLITRFRLPSTVTKMIGRDARLQDAIRARIAPLWEWHPGENELATVISSDRFSVVETPLYFAPTADPDDDQAAPRKASIQVWVGTDPFTVVTTRSDLYVDTREDYLRAFEPTTAAGRHVVARTALAQAISAAILEHDEAREQYGKYVRSSAINAELTKLEKQRRRLVKAYETRAAALCKVLDDQLFQALLTASLDDELIDMEGDSERSPAVSNAVEALGVAARRLEESRFGRALYMDWVSEAETNTNHFLNRIVLPTKTVHESAFKAFRWGSKSLASIVKTVLEHRVALRKVSTRLQLAELLEPAVRVSLPNHASQHIVDIEFAADMIDEVDVVVQRTKLSPKLRVRVPVPNEDALLLFVDWAEADLLTKTTAAKRFLGVRTYGGMVLDGVNVLLAMNKITEAEGSDARGKAMLSTGAAGLGAMRNVVDQVLNWDWAIAKFGIDEAAALGTRRVLAGMGGVLGLYYSASNLFGAEDAFRSGDNDRGYALSVASAAEFAGVLGELYWILTPASMAAPWIVVGAAAVAATAYIAAELTKDDPLAEFLRRCEWGTERYAPLNVPFSWDEKSVGEWKDDIPHQSVLLLRAMVCMRAWWDLDSWPAVTVAWNLQDSSAKVEVEWTHTFKDGRPTTPLRTTLSGDELNWRSEKHELQITPSRVYTSMSGLDRVTLTLRYRPNLGATASIMRCELMKDGVGIPHGKLEIGNV